MPSAPYDAAAASCMPEACEAWIHQHPKNPQSPGQVLDKGFMLPEHNDGRRFGTASMLGGIH